MDCRDVKRNIPSLLYEELSGELEQEIRNHIDSCPACSEVWEESRKARSYLDLWPDIDSRPDPAAIVKEASRRPARREPRFVRARRWLPLLAAASLLLFFLFALVEVEVNRANGDLVITIGRAAAEDGPMFPGSDGNIPDLVHDEVEAGIQDLFEVIGRQLDVVMQRQEKNHTLLARALQMQREEDLRITREMIRHVVDRSTEETEKTQQFCRELAGIVCRGIPEPLQNGQQPMKH